MVADPDPTTSPEEKPHSSDAGGAGLRSGRTVVLLAAITVAALLLRLLYLREVSTDILYSFPVLDEDHYHEVAGKMAAGEPVQTPYWRPPGLYFALAASIKVFGPGALPLRLIQVLTSVLCVGLTWWLARRFYSSRIAMTAAALVALNGVLIAATVEIKDTNWTLLFNLVALILFAEAARRQSLAAGFLAGLACGVSALFRPVILAFLPVAVLWLVLNVRGRRAWGLAGLVTLGALVPILPVTWQNNHRGGPFVLICTNGGMNFFIGNNENYRNTVTARPGNQWDAAVLEPARRAGYPWEGSQREQFYFRAAVDYLKSHPLDGARLWLRKLYLFFNGHEIPRDTDIYLDTEGSAVLRPFVWKSWPLLPMGLIIPLSIVGMAGAVRGGRKNHLLVAFLLVQAVTVAAFFVSSRYRVPSIPVLSIFAAAGAFRIADQFRTTEGPRRFGWAGVALLLAALLNLPTAETRQSLAAERFYFKANALDRLGRYDEALRHYRLAADLDTTDVRPLQGIGARLESQGDLEGAVAAWRRVNRIGPYSARDRDRLVSLLMKQGRWREAMVAIRADLELTEHLPARSASNYFKLGVLNYEMSRLDASLEAFRNSAGQDIETWIRSIVDWSRTAKRDAPGGTDSLEEGRYWLSLARLASQDRSASLSLPVWHRADSLLAGDAAARAEIAAQMEMMSRER